MRVGALMGGALGGWDIEGVGACGWGLQGQVLRATHLKAGLK